MKIKNGFSLIIKIGFIIVIIVVSFFLSQKANRINNKITRLPSFTTNTVSGKIINSNKVESNLFIIFINTNADYHIDLLENVYLNYAYKNLKIIVFTKHEKIVRKIINLFPLALIINENYEKYENKFKAKSCCGQHYLFNRLGELVAFSINTTNYQDGIKIYLMELIDNINFNLSYFITDKNIFNMKKFSQCWDFIKNNDYDFFVISLFAEMCSLCESGKIISEINNLYNTRNNKIGFLTILSNDFEKNDVQNFKSNLKIKYKVIRADSSLAKNWNNLIKTFRRSDLTNIILLTNKEGTILKINKEALKHIKRMKED